MKLQFHQQLFDALGIAPAPSRDQMGVLAQRERECHVRFLAAVCEWFSIEGVFDLFRAHTNADELVTNNSEDWKSQLAALGDPEEVSKGYLRVAVENQGVVAFYVRLDGSDDPPVVHNNDD